MIDAARNKIRVKACYVMMAVTIGACLLMVIMGKRVSDSGFDALCLGALFFSSSCLNGGKS